MNFFGIERCCCDSVVECWFAGNVSGGSSLFVTNNATGANIVSHNAGLVRRLRTDNAGTVLAVGSGGCRIIEPRGSSLTLTTRWTSSNAEHDCELTPSGTVVGFDISTREVVILDVTDASIIDTLAIPWAAWVGATPTLNAIAVDASGNIGILGSTGASGGRCWLVVMDSSGSLIWRTETSSDIKATTTSGADTFGRTSEIAFDASGSLYYAISNGAHGGFDNAGSPLFRNSNFATSVVVDGLGFPIFGEGLTLNRRDPASGTVDSTCTISGGGVTLINGLAWYQSFVYASPRIKLALSGCSTEWSTLSTQLHAVAAPVGRVPLFQ